MDAPDLPAEAEVANLDVAVAVEQYVGRLDVSVDDAGLVKVVDPLQDLKCYKLEHMPVNTWLIRQNVGQVKSHVAHDEV